MLDIGAFFAQIIPVILIYLLIPTSILMVWFGYFRPRQKKKQAEKLAQSNANTSSTTSALDLLNDARQKGDSDPIDTGMLPDLDSLLTPGQKASQKSPDGKLEVTLNTGDKRKAKEVFVVLRDETDGRLMIQIDETAYRSLKGTGDARKTFTTVMKELSTYILKEDMAQGTVTKETKSTDSVKLETLLTEKSEPVIEDKPITESKVTSASKPVSGSKNVPKSNTPPPPLADGTLPGDLPSYKFDDNPANIEKKRGRVTKVEFTPPPEVDIVGAIEAYLQYKINHTPEYQGKNIHVHPSPSGGVSIQVDNEYFDSVDEVSNQDVRAFLRETIDEWQDRQ